MKFYDENSSEYKDYQGETRPFELTATGDVYKFPTTHCAFCKHCTDLFWDYTSGPYMFMCDKDCELVVSENSCTCEGFEDDGYVFDEAEYRERMEKRKQEREQFEKMLDADDGKLRKEFDEIIKKAINKMFGFDSDSEKED